MGKDGGSRYTALNLEERDKVNIMQKQGDPQADLMGKDNVVNDSGNAHLSVLKRAENFPRQSNELRRVPS